VRRVLLLWLAAIAVLAVTVAAWLAFYSARRQSFGELRLTYDDLPEPAIHGLNLLR